MEAAYPPGPGHSPNSDLALSSIRKDTLSAELKRIWRCRLLGTRGPREGHLFLQDPWRKRPGWPWWKGASRCVTPRSHVGLFRWVALYQGDSALPPRGHGQYLETFGLSPARWVPPAAGGWGQETTQGASPAESSPSSPDATSPRQGQEAQLCSTRPEEWGSGVCSDFAEHSEVLQGTEGSPGPLTESRAGHMSMNYNHMCEALTVSLCADSGRTHVGDVML